MGFTSFGWKKACDNRIVLLWVKGKNNENRSGIYNKIRAKYRCSEAVVLRIYKRSEDGACIIEDYNEARSIHDENFVYKLGEYARADDFNNNLYIYCTGGIHYFINEEMAFLYKNKPRNGMYVTYWPNGHLERRRNYVDGKKNGLYERFNSCGIKKLKCYFKDDKKHGEYIEYYKNGQIMKTYNYINGKKNGMQQEYRNDGSLKVAYMYKNGKRNGRYREYHLNGTLFKLGFYKNNKMNGELNIWWPNGSLKEISYIVNGKFDQSKDHKRWNHHGDPVVFEI